jgi:plastocyanin
MRTNAILVLLTAAAILQPASGQAAAALDVTAAMEDFTTATLHLTRAVQAGRRDAYDAELRRIERWLPALATLGGAEAPAARDRAIAGLRATIADLRAPVGAPGGGANAPASDAFDFARLRRACTECHVVMRGDPRAADEAGRGLFPNVGNVVAGRVQVSEREGQARADHGDVVVFLEPSRAAAPTPLPRNPTISQRGRRFDPSVLVLTTGTTVVFPNDDVVFHNVFSRSRAAAFDLGTYGRGHERHHTFAQPGLVKVHCNIHPDMASHVLVLDTPLSAVTAPDGAWTIADVPDGDYTLRLWHALADEQRLAITVAGGQLRNVSLAVRESRPRVQHTNKHGRAYEGY